MNFYSNGKLLLTGEYLVLDGATSLAVPTNFGQDLLVETINKHQLIWESYTYENTLWFQAIFDIQKFRLISATFESNKEGSAEFIAETLLDILTEAKKLNPDFLKDSKGYSVKTKLTFPRNWGLGSSSTLINSIATWAQVDAFTLLWNSFKGSGYDIACAQNNKPIFYALQDAKPIVTQVDFNPIFKENLFFVHLNKKQDSKEGIANYKKVKAEHSLRKEIDEVSKLSQQFLESTSLSEMQKLMVEHEQIISTIIKTKTVKQKLFSDYEGAVKSLGAWGGDFILAAGNEQTPNYFREKGFSTVLPYSEMIL